MKWGLDSPKLLLVFWDPNIFKTKYRTKKFVKWGLDSPEFLLAPWDQNIFKPKYGTKKFVVKWGLDSPELLLFFWDPNIFKTKYGTKKFVVKWGLDSPEFLLAPWDQNIFKPKYGTMKFVVKWGLDSPEFLLAPWDQNIFKPKYGTKKFVVKWGLDSPEFLLVPWGQNIFKTKYGTKKSWGKWGLDSPEFFMDYCEKNEKDLGPKFFRRETEPAEPWQPLQCSSLQSPNWTPRSWVKQRKNQPWKTEVDRPATTTKVQSEMAWGPAFCPENAWPFYLLWLLQDGSDPWDQSLLFCLPRKMQPNVDLLLPLSWATRTLRWEA